MARLLVHRLYKFVMVLTLFVSVGMAAGAARNPVGIARRDLQQLEAI